MKKWFGFLLIVLMSLGLFACGSGGGSSSGDDVASVTGQFIDSAVSGLIYQCLSGEQGVTNAFGEFTCTEGDTVDFYIGKYFIGSSEVKEEISPYDLYPDNEDAAINVAQLLQTLDLNKNPSDGITIPDNFTTLDQLQVGPEEDSFENDVQVSINKLLVSEIEAKAHLNFSLTGKPEIPWAYVQWRTHEDVDNVLVRGWVELPQGLKDENISNIVVEDSSGNIVAEFDDFNYSFTDALNIYDCRFESCISDKVKVTDYGYWLNLPEETQPGFYTYVVTDNSGTEYEQAVEYKGEISVPVVDSSSIFLEWNADGSLTVDWINPVNEENWDKVNQLRVNVDSGERYNYIDASYDYIIVKVNPDMESQVTIPSSELSKVFNETEKTWLRAQVNTRAYQNHENYSRGVSNRAELRDPVIPLRYSVYDGTNSQTDEEGEPIDHNGEVVPEIDIVSSNFIVNDSTIDIEIVLNKNIENINFNDSEYTFYGWGAFFDTNYDDNETWDPSFFRVRLWNHEGTLSCESGCSFNINENKITMSLYKDSFSDSFSIDQDTPVRIYTIGGNHELELYNVDVYPSIW